MNMPTQISSPTTTSTRSSTEERAIIMLGEGTPAVVVASTLGVSESRISQLLADEGIAEEVRSLRYKRSEKINARDKKADEIEDKLLTQLDQAIPLLMRPMEIARTLSLVNAMKRRGVAAPDSMTERSAIVTITMPKKITQQFTTNINNQVIQAGTQELLTIQSGAMDSLVAVAKKEILPKISQG